MNFSFAFQIVFLFCIGTCAFFEPASAKPNASSRSSFTDTDLQRIFKQSQLKSKELFLIYNWSPHMNLSIRGLQNIKDRKNVTVLLDPNSNYDLAKKSILAMNFEKTAMKVNHSKSLFGQGALIHYPSYIFIKNGRFAGGLLPGYKSDASLERYIASVVNKR